LTRRAPGRGERAAVAGLTTGGVRELYDDFLRSTLERFFERAALDREPGAAPPSGRQPRLQWEEWVVQPSFRKVDACGSS
jgi:hypothetical protein